MKNLYKKLTTKLSHDSSNISPTNANSASIPKVSAFSPPTLHSLYSASDPKLDVIALHGLNGDALASFTHQPSGILWLRDLLPLYFPSARVLSIGYTLPSTSSSGSVEDIATSIISTLISSSPLDTQRPIVWIAHSYGVLLLKGILSLAASASGIDETGGKVLLEKTQGIMFFGMPTDSSRKFKVLLSSVPGDGEPPISPEMEVYVKELKWMREACDNFEGIVSERSLRVRHFDERTNGMAGTGGYGEDGQGGVEVIRLDKTHGGLIRYESGEDEDFKTVMIVLRELVEDVDGAAIED